jgi:RNA polymerase subunit RPABC4/transcription elongation factor Spt4
MAIVKCRECGEEVSNKAEKCPRCGVKTPHSTDYWTGAYSGPS